MSELKMELKEQEMELEKYKSHYLDSYIQSKYETKTEDGESVVFSHSDFEDEIADILENVENNKLLTPPTLTRSKSQYQGCDCKIIKIINKNKNKS